MKHLFVTCLFLFSISVFSQDDSDASPTDKGSFLVNGAFNFNTSKLDARFVEDASTLNFSLSPRAAYFVIDRLAVGLDASFMYSKEDFTYLDGENLGFKTTILTAGPFVRYYLKNGLFAEANIGFGIQNSERENEFVTGDAEADFFSYEFGVGYAIFFNNSVSLEPFLSYQFDRQTQNENDTDVSGLNLGVGFTFYF